LKAAKLRSNVVIEDIHFHRPRGLDRNQILNLAESRWVANHHSILIVGPTGCGKTYLACALAHAARRHGHSALYYLRAPRMLDDLTIARADGRLTRLLASWARVDVLLIDDLVLRPLIPDQAADLLEVIEDRALLRSTIVTSQLPGRLSAKPPSLTPSSTGCSRPLTALSSAASPYGAPRRSPQSTPAPPPPALWWSPAGPQSPNRAAAPKTVPLRRP
jgi:energy-coupling factor transporter ATP-binding protein EcfA2